MAKAINNEIANVFFIMSVFMIYFTTNFMVCPLTLI